MRVRLAADDLNGRVARLGKKETEDNAQADCIGGSVNRNKKMETNVEQLISQPIHHVAASRRLRIAQIAPLYESVPPKLYGGTERVVSNLTEELVRRGHEVTLFASGDSQTSARLEPGHPVSLRMAGLNPLGASLQMQMLSSIYEQAHRFDIIHGHLDYWTFPFSRLVPIPPTITTMHGRLDISELRPIYEHFPEMPLVSISDSQRRPLPFMNWVGTIYHGLPRDLLRPNYKPGNYLAFLGRISPEKRPDLAIEVATRAGVPLKIAAKVDPVDREYFASTIKPLLSRPGVEYIGEIDDSQKSEFLGNALAVLFTIEWPEPFGLVMIESMACGTPVIARPYGSVREIMRHGVTGLIAHDIDEMVAAVKRIETVSREACRAEFEARFAVDVMAARYERLYEQLIDLTRGL